MFWKLPALGKISKIGIVPPQPEPGREGVAVALIVKNEARHIGEWAEFHLRAGVRRFLIYDNGSSDGRCRSCARCCRKRRATVVPWRQVFSDAWLGREIHNQVLAYAHAASNFGGAFRWMAFIDADEFLVPKQAASIPEALAHLGEARNLSLPWHMFGRSGHAEAAGGRGVAELPAAGARSDERRARGPGIQGAGRSLPSHRGQGAFDGDRRVRRGRCNDAGVAAEEKERARPGFYSAAHLQLNHYYTRSEAELAAKIGRGPNLVAKSPEYERKVRRTVANIEADEIEDRAALDYLARIGWEPCAPS